MLIRRALPNRADPRRASNFGAGDEPPVWPDLDCARERQSSTDRPIPVASVDREARRSARQL